MPKHYVQRYFDESWKHTEGVEDLGFQFGADRAFPGVSPLGKASGVKGRRGNPTQKQLSYTNGAGLPVDSSDQVWTIWSSTFIAEVMPKHGDIILVNDVADRYSTLVQPVEVVERWIVQWSKWVLYGAQYVCYCSESPLTRDTIY